MMMCEDDMVVEFFADDPSRNNGIFQVFANFHVPKCLEDSQEAKFRSFCNPFDFIVINFFISIKDIRTCSSSEGQIDKLLSTMTMVSNQRIRLDIHLFFYLLRTFC